MPLQTSCAVTQPQAEFTSYFLTHQRELKSFAIALTRNVHDAEDLLQQTWLKGFENLSSFQPGTNQIAWMTTIMRNAYFSGLRKNRRLIQVDEMFFNAIPGSTPRPDILIDIHRGLASLPCRKRNMVFKADVLGYTIEELAHSEGTIVNTVKSQLNRSREPLRQFLAAEDMAPLPEATSHSRAKAPLPVQKVELSPEHLSEFANHDRQFSSHQINLIRISKRLKMKNLSKYLSPADPPAAKNTVINLIRGKSPWNEDRITALLSFLDETPVSLCARIAQQSSRKACAHTNS